MEDIEPLPGTPWLVAAGVRNPLDRTPGRLYLVDPRNGRLFEAWPGSGTISPSGEFEISVPVGPEQFNPTGSVSASATAVIFNSSPTRSPRYATGTVSSHPAAASSSAPGTTPTSLVTHPSAPRSSATSPNPQPGSASWQAIFALSDAAQLERLLLNAGFGHVSIDLHTDVVTCPTPHAWIEGFLSAAPVHAIATVTNEARDLIIAEVARDLHSYIASDGRFAFPHPEQHRRRQRVVSVGVARWMSAGYEAFGSTSDSSSLGCDASVRSSDEAIVRQVCSAWARIASSAVVTSGQPFTRSSAVSTDALMTSPEWDGWR